MSNKQFWSFLDLDFIYNTTFAKLFYKCACDFNDNTKSDHIKFMDYSKFIQFVAIFTKDVVIELNGKLSLTKTRKKFTSPTCGWGLFSRSSTLIMEMRSTNSNSETFWPHLWSWFSSANSTMREFKRRLEMYRNFIN